MPYQEKQDRNQVMLCSMDSLVAEDSMVRLIAAFVEGLDMRKLGFDGPSAEGRPEFDPRNMLGLYIYGCRKGIRSSRKLEDACEVNIEVMWLMCGMRPDFRTISDFRKNNIGCLRKVFHEFNEKLGKAIEYGYLSLDGTKIRAVNSKDRSITKVKAAARIKRLEDETDSWLKMIEEIDRAEASGGVSEPGTLTRGEIEARIADAQRRKEEYERVLEVMDEKGVSQVSLTDGDSRLMKDKEGFTVSYNAQTMVDSETHIIRDYMVTNRVTDHGLMKYATEGIRKETDGILEVVADNGYNMGADMLACLMNGEVPHVKPARGKDGFTLETAYEPQGDLHPESLEPGEIEKCLRSGVVPDAYKDVLTAEVVTVNRKDKPADPEEKLKSPYGTKAEMEERAKEGYFVRDPEADVVYCPNAVLTRKCTKKNDDIRYANKLACRNCPYKEKCSGTKNAWVEVDFTKDGLERPIKGFHKDEGAGETPPKKRGGGKMKKLTLVRLVLRPDQRKTSKRFGISECPFGTMKRAMGCTHFLLRGKEKVDGEFALFALGYNLERAKNMLGFDRLMELMRG